MKDQIKEQNDLYPQWMDVMVPAFLGLFLTYIEWFK